MDTKGKILSAAVAQFEACGYTGATTLSIAKAAGISEMTVFRYFKNKENLFHEAVSSITSTSSLSSLRGSITGSIETDLTLIAECCLTYFVQENHMIRMMLFESMAHPELVAEISQSPMQNLHFLHLYFQKQMDLGILRPSDPQRLAEIFLSSLFGYAIGLQSLQISEQTAAQIKAYAASAVSLFLSGILEKP